MSYSVSDRYTMAHYAIKGAFKQDPTFALTHFRQCPSLLTRRKGSLLHLMIEEDRWSLLESVLMENPDLIWHQNHKQMSLLYFAIMLRKYDIGSSLVKLQPGLTQMICKNLKTPLHLASTDETMPYSLIPCIGSAIAAVTTDRQGCTPLHYYVRFYGCVRWMRTFLYLSMAPLSMKNNLGQTPYHIAINNLGRIHYQIAIDSSRAFAEFLSMFEDQRDPSLAMHHPVEKIRESRFEFYFQRSLTSQLLAMICVVPDFALKIGSPKKSL